MGRQDAPQSGSKNAAIKARTNPEPAGPQAPQHAEPRHQHHSGPKGSLGRRWRLRLPVCIRRHEDAAETRCRHSAIQGSVRATASRLDLLQPRRQVRLPRRRRCYRRPNEESCRADSHQRKADRDPVPRWQADQSRPSLIANPEVEGSMKSRLAPIFLLLAAPALPQFELGSIVGLVTDPSKAPLSGAAVEIRSLTTNVRREVLTNSSGEYNSLPLQPGRYEVLVKAPGFKNSATEVTLAVNQRLQADF